MTPNPESYAGKVALVTGSRRGLGKLIAEHLLQRGARCIGFARGPSSITSSNYSHFELDVGNAPAVQDAFDQVRKMGHGLHIVVNNAAVLTSQYSMVMPPLAAQEMINTNLLGTFLVSREAAKLMRKSRWGRIINVSSMAVSLEPPGDSMYAATKAGITTLANVMAKEFASINVTCNTLGVSAYETDMLRQLPRDRIDEVISRLPLPRFAESDDILNVVDFFASERSSYVTAQTIFLGGVH